MLNTPATYSHLIKTKALEIGFDACGFSESQRLDTEAERLAVWLDEQHHASMDWMAKNFDKRIDPGVLVPGTRSVISLLASYHHPSHRSSLTETETPQIAKYAQGRDYHKVLKSKMKILFKYIQELIPGTDGRFFTDSAPVLDKAWAVRSGLGWVGKNSNILNKRFGSYFLLGEILINIPLEYDKPTTDHCGNCTACIDACPTDAIYEPYKIDANKCISYLTIEHDGEIDEKYHTDIKNWVFGCDICQEVCPWNSKARLAQFADLHPRPYVLDAADRHFNELTKPEFESLFEGSPVRRTKFEGFERNLKIVQENLQRMTDDDCIN
tara:strand:+ start:276031 stop:277005 length:975 start_codon:yes stop_codon:yes gene_type:complete